MNVIKKEKAYPKFVDQQRKPFYNILAEGPGVVRGKNFGNI